MPTRAKGKTNKQRVQELTRRVRELETRLTKETTEAAEFINSLSNGSINKDVHDRLLKEMVSYEKNIEDLYKLLTCTQIHDDDKTRALREFVYETRAEIQLRRIYNV